MSARFAPFNIRQYQWQALRHFCGTAGNKKDDLAGRTMVCGRGSIPVATSCAIDLRGRVELAVGISPGAANFGRFSNDLLVAIRGRTHQRFNP